MLGGKGLPESPGIFVSDTSEELGEPWNIRNNVGQIEMLPKCAQIISVESILGIWLHLCRFL